jgi:hypothetical protein
MAGGGDLGFYIGAYANDAAATAFLTGRGYTQARGYEYYDTNTAQVKKWDGAAWGVITGPGATSPWRDAAGVVYLGTLTDDVVIGSAAMSAGERFRVVGGQRIEKSDTAADDALYIQVSGSHPITERAVMIDVDVADLGVPALLIDSEVDNTSLNGSPLIQLEALSTNPRGDIAFTSVRTADPTALVKGDLWWHDTAAAFKYYDGVSVQTISAGGTSPWSEAGAPAVIYPTTYATDDVVIGANAMSGTERFRVAGDARFDSGTVGIGDAPNAVRALNIRDDLDDTNATYGAYVRLYSNDTGTKAGWIGVLARSDHDSTGTITDCIGLASDALGGSGCTYTSWTGVKTAPFLDHASDLITTYHGVYVADSAGNGTITTAYGMRIGDVGLSTTTAYALYIDDQNATTTYGIYQTGADDPNYLAAHTGVGVTPNSARMLYVRDDLDDSGATYGVYVLCPFDGTGTKSGWYGVYVVSNQDSTGTITDAIGVASTAQGGQGSTYTTWAGVATSALLEHASDVITTYYGFRVAPTAGDNGTVTTGYGLRVEDVGQNSTTVYGVYIDDQNASTTYGLYQAGTDDLNVLRGDTVVGTTAMAGTEVFRSYSAGTSVGLRSALIETDLTGGSVASLYNLVSFVNVDGTISASGFVRNVQIASVEGSGSVDNSADVYQLFIQSALDGPSGSPTTYGVYQDGTDDLNYFGGRTGIRTETLSDAMLRVLDDRDTTSAVWGERIYLDHSGASSTTLAWTGLDIDSDVTSGAVTTLNCINLSGPSGTNTVTNMRGILINQMGTGAVTGTAYGINQTSSTDVNRFEGKTGIGADYQSDAWLYVEGAYSGTIAATRYGTRSKLAYSGGSVTLSAGRALSTVLDVGTTATITDGYGVYADSPTGAGTISACYGVFIEAQETGPASVGFGVYQNGTNDVNVFAADTSRFGPTASSDQRVDIDGGLRVAAADYIYFGPSGTDGTWRMGRSGNNFIFQRRESGSYVTKQTITP